MAIIKITCLDDGLDVVHKSPVGITSIRLDEDEIVFEIHGSDAAQRWAADHIDRILVELREEKSYQKSIEMQERGQFQCSTT